jgi:hypothetical protein
LKERNPFTPGTNLRNIETGVIADGKVDVDRSVEIGNNILRSMVGQPAEQSPKFQIVSTRLSVWACLIIPDGSNKTAGLLQSSYRNISDKSGNMPIILDMSLTVDL